MSTLPEITFIKGQGGLGRPLTGKDFVSALVFYVANGSLPSGFSTTARVKAFYSVADAIAAGIGKDYADATAATGAITMTAVGGNGDTVKVNVVEIDTVGVVRTISLGTFTKTASESTVTLLATAIAAMINSGTITHGFSAASALGVITITAPKRLGIYLNSGSPLSITIVGTMTGSVTTAFTGGTGSLTAVWYYHISEFFRMQPKGILYVGFYAIPGTYDFTEITTVQSFANGEVRQIGIFKDPASAFATANLTTIDTVCKANDALHKPISALYAANMSAVSDISTLTDLNALAANKASAVIGQDGGGQGNYLWLITGKSVTQLGALLGTVAFSSVGESVAWVGKFNISDGVENEVLGFANGQLYSSAAISETLLESLNSKRYIFLKKFIGISGSYWNDSHTAIVATSDYAYIENNRTIDKAIRNLYSAYLPQLNSPLELNSDGTLSDNTITYLESVGETSLDQMIRDKEMSAKLIQIDSAQNVLSTSKIVISATLVINGVARQIEIPIGFKPKIS